MIPTAKEFVKPFIKDCTDTQLELMIEFAKLHVEAALKEASEKAEIVADDKQDFRLQACNCLDYLIDKDSILNAYSLTLIK